MPVKRTYQAEKIAIDTHGVISKCFRLLHTKLSKILLLYYEETTGSKVCIVTAGVRQRQSETRLDLLKRNADIVKSIVVQLVKFSPDTVILMVTNPVDILTYIAWKVSGLPKERVIGSGTNLDTARFRCAISKKLGVGVSSCMGWIIGEHGDSSVPVWSGVSVAGVRISEINPEIGTEKDPERWTDVHKETVTIAYELIKRKGYTSTAVSLSCSSIVNSILRNSSNLHTVSVWVKGLHGIEDEVFVSLPVILGAGGVTDIVKQTLDNGELEALRRSVKVIQQQQSTITI